MLTIPLLVLLGLMLLLGLLAACHFAKLRETLFHPDTPQYSDVRLKAQLRLEKRALWWQTAYAANQARVEHYPSNAIFYCIHIEEIGGRRATADPAVDLSRSEQPASER